MEGFALYLYLLYYLERKEQGFYSPQIPSFVYLSPWYLWMHCSCHVASLPHTSLNCFVRKCFSLQFLGHSVYPYGCLGSSLTHISDERSGAGGLLSLRVTSVPFAALQLCDRLFLCLLIVGFQCGTLVLAACWVVMECNTVGGDFYTEDRGNGFLLNIGNHLQDCKLVFFSCNVSIYLVRWLYLFELHSLLCSIQKLFCSLYQTYLIFVNKSLCRLITDTSLRYLDVLSLSLSLSSLPFIIIIILLSPLLLYIIITNITTVTLVLLLLLSVKFIINNNTETASCLLVHTAWFEHVIRQVLTPHHRDIVRRREGGNGGADMRVLLPERSTVNLHYNAHEVHHGDDVSAWWRISWDSDIIRTGSKEKNSW